MKSLKGYRIKALPFPKGFKRLEAAACRLLLLLFMTWFPVPFLSAAPDDKKAPPAETAASDETQDLETLINTLNEVLEENRRIKQSLQENENALKKTQTENRTLQSQVRSLRRASEVSKSEGAELKTLRENIASMEGDAQKLDSVKTELEAKVAELERQRGEMAKLLDSAILESERVEFIGLLENAQETARRSADEMRENKVQNEQLKSDLSSAYYTLGNMLFDMRDFDNAIKSYEKALQANPQDGWVHHNLGIIYDYYLHDDARAIFHYQTFLQLRPMDEGVNQIRARIIEMELKKNIIPNDPLKKDFFEHYTKQPR